MREGRTGVQQMAAESTLFARQADLALHAWLFLGGVYMQGMLAFSPLNVIHYIQFMFNTLLLLHILCQIMLFFFYAI